MTEFSRRCLLAAGAVAAGASAFQMTPRPAYAAAPMAGTQAPGFYRRTIGGAEVTALLDGYLDLTPDFWTGIERDTLDSAIIRNFHSDGGNVRIGITSYLVNTGDRLILVDSGSADVFGPSAGDFLNTLAAAGHKPEQVDEILITHMHPDHIAALTSGNAAVFPNARVHVNANELNFWASEANMASASDGTKSWYQAALTVKKAYDNRLNVFSGEPELLTGITALDLSGHTPGQTGYHFNFGGEELLIWGDACGVAPVQFQHPEAGLIFDIDGEKGKKTRAKMLDMAAQSKILVASAHCPFPSFGHVARSGNAYAWVPDEYRYQV